MSEKMKAKLYDIVRLKDGKEGTVIEVYNIHGLPTGYDLELLDKEEIITITEDQIEEIIWEMP